MIGVSALFLWWIIGIKRETPVNSPHCGLLLFFAKKNDASSQKIFCCLAPGACDNQADDAHPVDLLALRGRQTKDVGQTR
jgi:hypothetical protein